MGQIDVSLKHAIAEFPQHWAEFLRVPPGVPVQVVDADVSAIANVADKALLVRADPEYILHVEPHGWYDEHLDIRMLGYNALMSRRFAVVVHTVVLLLDRRAWGPANKGCVVAESPLGDCRIDFRYQVIKVWELPVAQILASGVGVLPLAPIADVPQHDLPQVIEQMAKRFDAELPRTEAAEMWTATFVLVGLKYDKAFARVLLQKVRDTMRHSSTYQAILEEGKQDALIKQGTKRFGQPDAATVERINSIEDMGRLDALLLRLLDVNSWDELLAEEPSE